MPNGDASVLRSPRMYEYHYVVGGSRDAVLYGKFGWSFFVDRETVDLSRNLPAVRLPYNVNHDGAMPGVAHDRDLAGQDGRGRWNRKGLQDLTARARGGGSIRPRHGAVRSLPAQWRCVVRPVRRQYGSCDRRPDIGFAEVDSRIQHYKCRDALGERAEKDKGR